MIVHMGQEIGDQSDDCCNEDGIGVILSLGAHNGGGQRRISSIILSRLAYEQDNALGETLLDKINRREVVSL